MWLKVPKVFSKNTGIEDIAQNKGPLFQLYKTGVKTKINNLLIFFTKI